MSKLYFYVEDLGLTPTQRNTIVAELQALAPNVDRPQPCERNHWRISTDGLAAIFEADWDDATITALAVRNRLATICGVSQASITYATSTPTILSKPSEVATYSYSSAQKLRLGVFGGRAATWAESRAEAAEYLRQNQAAWEPAT